MATSSAKVPRPSTAHHEELNGIRGWAALSVVVFHLTWETFGVLMPELRNPVTGFLLDGSLAVQVFFGLSGEALSSAYFAGGGEFAVAKLAVRRYTRLTVPIAAACLLTLLVYRLGLTAHVEAARIVGRMEWMGTWLQPAPTLVHTATYALFRVYASPPPSGAFMPFLWTMRLEMAGSFLVFGLLLLFAQLRRPWLLIGAIYAIMAASDSLRDLSCFLAGIAFAGLRADGFFARLQVRRAVLPLSWLAIAAVAAFDGPAHVKYLYRGYTPLVAVVLLFAIFCNRPLCAFFASRLSRFLGKVSFPLYLIQFPFIVAVTAPLICYVHAKGVLTPAAMLGIAGVSIVGCIGVAYAFEPVERLTRWFGTRSAALVLDDSRRGRGPAVVPGNRREIT